MSKYYNPKRSRNMYKPTDKEPFRVSRSKIDLFMDCPKCFYLDRRLGTARPPGYPFSLNSAVDALLKKEFDIYRKDKTPHPLMEEFGVDAVPFQHEEMDAWRDSLRRGIRYLHEPTNLLITGGIDDVWVNPKGELIIVDYKATAKNSEINIDAEWQNSYKRQMEVYQWLFRQNGFKVSPTGYFVYANGRLNNEVFDAKLEFDIHVIPYEGETSWIEPKIEEIKKTLDSNKIPNANPDCDYCRYRDAANELTVQ